MSAALEKEQTPVVAAQDGQAVTTSLDVARYFGKTHKNVLQAIQKLLPQLPDHYSYGLNFQPILLNVRGYREGFRESPAYQLTRDGFVLLAMGFTGKRALQFKVAYIDAFNAMEAKLRQQQIWVGGLSQALEQVCPVPPNEPPNVVSQRMVKTLRAMSAYWALIEGMPQTAAESAVCVLGKIPQLDDFYYDREQGSESGFDDMYNFLEKVIAHSSAKDNQPASEQQINAIKYLLDACAQYKYSRDVNIYKLLEHYGVTVETILTATSSQAMRIANLAYQLLFGHGVLTDVINQIRAKAKEADEQRKLPKTEDGQPGDQP